MFVVKAFFALLVCLVFDVREILSYDVFVLCSSKEFSLMFAYLYSL
jgi:hypothetical protein